MKHRVKPNGIVCSLRDLVVAKPHVCLLPALLLAFRI